VSTGVLSRKSIAYGTLQARFVLDDNHCPKFSSENPKHYWIELIFACADKVAVESVSFVLDESTYTDPIRQASLTTDRKFVSTITSFGDYTVVAKVETGNEFLTISGALSQLLRRGHESELSANPQIAIAITDIFNN
jgi:hypothetical protein